MSIVAIAKRRKLLDDDLIVSLADSSWEILDISSSDVSDSGLAKVAEMCKSLRAVDIRYYSYLQRIKLIYEPGSWEIFLCSLYLTVCVTLIGSTDLAG